MSQIVAIGGGHQLFDLYISSLVDKKNPKVTYIGAANGERGAEGFKHFWEKTKNKVTHLNLNSPEKRAIRRNIILNSDVVYVGGGNSLNLISLLKAWKVDEDLHDAYNNGTIMAGASAGANIWFKTAWSDFEPGAYQPLSCLGLIPSSIAPHFTSCGMGARKRTFQQAIKSKIIESGYGIDDTAMIHFIDENPSKVYVAENTHGNSFVVDSKYKQLVPMKKERLYLDEESELYKKLIQRFE